MRKALKSEEGYDEAFWSVGSTFDGGVLRRRFKVAAEFLGFRIVF